MSDKHMRASTLGLMIAGDRMGLVRHLALHTEPRLPVYLYTARHRGHCLSVRSPVACRWLEEDATTSDSRIILADLGAINFEDLPPGSYDRRETQIQGLARVVHGRKLTALAWWDRSQDMRFGSVTVVIVPAAGLEFAAMLRAFKSAWPEIAERQLLPVRDSEGA